MASGYWTEERETCLRNLYVQGRTHLQIALNLSALYGPVTTTAVGAKCARLGMIRGQAKGHASPAKLEETDHTWPHKVTDTSVRFIERKSKQCPWPVGSACGAEMMCCGADRAVGKVYCREHNRAGREKTKYPLRF